jgi:F-type H+-transporting ATPase subunit delta
MSAVANYADAVYRIAEAENEVGRVEDELLQFAQALEANETLRSTLTDPKYPVAQRQQVVEDLLHGKAASATLAAVSMVVAAGRARDLPEIVRNMVDRSAARRNRTVAEVRTAVPLTADQSKRLADALQKSTGKEVELKVTVDPNVLGGIVTQIGDTVIDGSIRHRMNKMRETLS